MNQLSCNMCSAPPIVIDTEYDERYCHIHAVSYGVYDGPHLSIPHSDHPPQ